MTEEKPEAATKRTRPKVIVAESGRAPTPIADLEKRLALLARFCVRNYRDGILSIDLEPSRKREAEKSDEFPAIPDM